jgi:hypothetical protein
MNRVLLIALLLGGAFARSDAPHAETESAPARDVPKLQLTEAAPPAVLACNLLNADQVAQLVGAPIEGRESRIDFEDGVVHTCLYVRHPAHATVVVTILKPSARGSKDLSDWQRETLDDTKKACMRSDPQWRNTKVSGTSIAGVPAVLCTSDFGLGSTYVGLSTMIGMHLIEVGALSRRPPTSDELAVIIREALPKLSQDSKATK